MISISIIIIIILIYTQVHIKDKKTYTYIIKSKSRIIYDKINVNKILHFGSHPNGSQEFTILYCCRPKTLNIT